MGASPRGQTSLKVAVGDLFGTRCVTCGRSLVIDEVIWPSQDAVDEAADGGHDDAARADADDAHEAEPQPAPARDEAADGTRFAPRKVYSCPVCRGPRGGDQRSADLDDGALRRARTVPDDFAAIRARLRDRFPVVE